jgi:hypothetical protein
MSSSAALACYPGAIDPAARPRYNALVKLLSTTIISAEELADGYNWNLNADAITLPEIAEWMAMERLCCPFLTLQLATSGVVSHWSLTLTGPPGTKAILRQAFPAFEIA